MDSESSFRLFEICHFDFRGWVTLHYSAEIIFKESQRNLWSLSHLEPTSFLNTLANTLCRGPISWKLRKKLLQTYLCPSSNWYLRHTKLIHSYFLSQKFQQLPGRQFKKCNKINKFCEFLFIFFKKFDDRKVYFLGCATFPHINWENNYEEINMIGQKHSVSQLWM